MIFLFMTVGMIFFHHKYVSKKWDSIPYEKYLQEEQYDKRGAEKDRIMQYIKYNAY